jgi:hypothetical protein
MDRRKAFLTILALALAVRLGAFLLAASGRVVVGEGRVFVDVATNILEGRGMSLSPSMLDPVEEGVRSPRMHSRTFEFYRRVDGFYGVLRPGRPTTFFVPGYPLFMAGVFRVAGTGNLDAVRGLQLALGLLTVLLGLKLAARHLSGTPLLLVGLFLAADPFQVYYEAIPVTQALFSLLFTAGLAASCAVLAGPGPLRAAGAMLLWGCAFMFRPMALPVAALFLGGMLILSPGPLRTRVVSALAGAAVFCAVLAPWLHYTASVTGSPRLLPALGGVNMWESTSRIFSSHFEDELRGASMLYQPLRDEMLDEVERPWLAEFPEFREEPEWVRDSVLTARSMEFLRANPSLVPRLALLHFTDFIKPFPLNEFPLSYSVAGALTFGLLSLFASAGAVLLLLGRVRRAESVFLVLTAAGYTAAHLLSSSGTPQRVALDPLLALFAGAAVERVLARIRRGGG